MAKDPKGGKRRDIRSIGIREKVLAAFLVLSILPLGIFGAITLSQVATVADISNSTGRDALIQQARRNLLRLATDQANETSRFLDSLVGSLAGLQSKAEDMWNDPAKYGNGSYPAFRYTNSSQTPLAPGLPAYGYLNNSQGEGSGAWADWQKRLQGAPHLNSSVVKKARADSAYAAWVTAEQDKAMRLDLALKSAYDEQAPHAVLAWIVRLGGISNAYGRPNVDFGYLLWLGTVTKGKEGLTDKFDEDRAPYVLEAGPAKNPARKSVFLSPYYDSVGNGWIVSVVAPVYKGSDFVATVGIDVRLDALVSAILTLRAYESGQAFLVTSAGAAVAHRDLERVREEKMKNDPTAVDVGIDELLPRTKSYEDAIAKMKGAAADPAGSKSGIADATDPAGDRHLIAYAPIPKLAFALGVDVPEREVLAPVALTSERISADAATASTAIAVVTVLASIVAVVVGLVVSSRVVRPVRRLTELASRLGSGQIDESILDRPDLKVESKDAERKDEVGELTTAFGSMLDTIRADIKAQQKPTTIVIKDSVISRSAIGASAESEKKDEGLKFCPFCGEGIKTIRRPKYCPNCRKELPKA
jgi:HAMP domain-containing protein